MQISCGLGWSVEIFLIGQNGSTKQSSGMILEIQIQNFCTHVRGACPRTRVKVFIFKKFQGLKYQYFVVKLPFTIKNKCRNTNLKFEFQNYFIFTPQKARFWFLKKNKQFLFSSCFGSDSALKTINTQLLFCSVFLKTHQKKVINRQKRHFGHF